MWWIIYPIVINIVDNNYTTAINFSVSEELVKVFHYDHDRSTIITSNVRKEMANYAWRMIKHDIVTQYTKWNLSTRSVFLHAYLLSQPQPCRSLSYNQLSAHRLLLYGTIFSARTWCRDPVPLCSLTKDLSPVSLRGA